MSPNVDLRVRRTQAAIRDAFMELIVTHGFDKVTVRDVAARAGINRATFYRHFQDIHDLAHRLTDVLFADITAQIDSQPLTGDPSGWQLLFEHVAQYAPFYRATLGPGGIPGFRERVREAVEQQMLRLLRANGYDGAHSRMPPPLPVRYLAAAQVGFIQWWLEQDMPFPPAEAAAYLLQLHLHGGSRALGLETGHG